MTVELLDKLQTLFFQCLQDKTNWGRNDLMTLYKDCQIEVLRERVTELEEDLK